MSSPSRSAGAIDASSVTTAPWRAAGARVGDFRAPWVVPALGAFALVVFVAVLYLTSYKNFYYDEWDFVTAYRPLQSTSILLPHNEHWSTIPILIWKLLFVLFGLRTHLPYEAVALATHIAAVAMLFVFIRRHSGDLPALAAALTLLLLGTGATDIVWAFQSAWTLSIAFGLLAMLLADGAPPTLRLGRIAAISGALLGAIMSSGIGLGFLAAVTLPLLIDRQRRRYWLAVAGPIAIYLVWFVFYGAGIRGTPGALCPTCPTAFGSDVGSIGPGYVTDVLAYVASGLEASAAGVIGQTGVIGVAVLVVVSALLAWHWYLQQRVQSWELGLVAGLVAQFTLIGLVRVRFGQGGAVDSHYVYVGVVYLLPLVANALKHLPWRGAWRPLIAGGFALALLANAILLAQQAISQTLLMQTQNAELRTLELFRGAPDMAMNRELDDQIVPQLTAATYFAAVDELGSPIPASTPPSLEALPAATVDHEMVVLFGDAIKVTYDSSDSTLGLVCRTVGSSAGSILDLQVPDGGSVLLRATTSGVADLSLGFLNPPPADPLKQATLPAGVDTRIQMPITGRNLLWRLRVTASSVGDLRVCTSNYLRIQTGAAVLSAEAAGGALDPVWVSVEDIGASGGLAAELPAGTATKSFMNDIFGTLVISKPAIYDVWFRVRVTHPGGTQPEMILGLWDYTAWRWVGSTTFAANSTGSGYAWVKAATGVTPVAGHRVVFIAEFANHSAPLSTDWYIDEAVIVPNGASPPSQ